MSKGITFIPNSRFENLSKNLPLSISSWHYSWRGDWCSLQEMWLGPSTTSGDQGRAKLGQRPSQTPLRANLDDPSKYFRICWCQWQSSPQTDNDTVSRYKHLIYLLPEMVDMEKAQGKSLIWWLENNQLGSCCPKYSLVIFFDVDLIWH